MLLGLVVILLAAAPPEAAIISTPGEGDVSELRFQRPGATELAAPVASFSHVKRSTVLGSVLPGTRTVLAIAQTSQPRELSWSASLVRLEPGKPPVTLADRVAISTRPLVTKDGRVFVQRGRGEAITVDEVNPKTGATRTIHSFTGYTAFLAGSFEGEVLLYRVNETGADLVAVHRDALGVRVLVPRLEPMARDFASDGHALYFTTADQEGWLVARVDLKTGALGTVARVSDVTALPTVLPGGLALSRGPGEGLRFTDGKLALLPHGARGFERVLDVRLGYAFVLHEVPSGFPTAYAVDLKTGRALDLAAPAGVRLDLAGAVE